MARILAGLFAGVIFGMGLSISGLINPARVIGFLDVAGEWDPSLAFVMLGAVSVTALGYRTVLRRSRPLFEAGFTVPKRADIDPQMTIGAGLFGVGWGLSGICPGPALSGLGFGASQSIAFVAAMLLGMIVARQSSPLFDRLKWKTKSAP